MPSPTRRRSTRSSRRSRRWARGSSAGRSRAPTTTSTASGARCRRSRSWSARARGACSPRSWRRRVAALRKPHRVGVLAPAVAMEGADVAYERELALLIWMACIETCQRHPSLAVYDPESTPLFPQDGHFAPLHAGRGAELHDLFWDRTRRDELVWLEIPAAKSGIV